MLVRRAAWACGSYVRFSPEPKVKVVGTACIWNDRDTPEFEEYGIDLDRNGMPVGVELVHRSCDDE